MQTFLKKPFDRGFLATKGGELEFINFRDGIYQVDMPIPRWGWSDIPLTGTPPKVTDPTLEIDRAWTDPKWGVLKNPTATNMGNPHVTFFVADVDAIEIKKLGPMIEHDPLFPERVNVGIAQIIDRATIRLRVWERGAGLTLACGSGACAAMVAAVRRGLVDRKATLKLDGGDLSIAWESPASPVLMTGAATLAYRGTWDDDGGRP